MDPMMLKPFQSFFEWFFHKAKMVAEGILICAVNRFKIGLWVIGTKSNPFWEFCFRHRRIHFDQHMIETADIVIAKIFKQLLCLFSLAICSHTRRKAQLGRYPWKSMQRALLSPIHHPSTDAHVFISGIDTS